MASRTAELFIKVLMDTKEAESGLHSLGASLQRIGEFAVGELAVKGLEALVGGLKDAAGTAIQATGDWEKLQMTLSNMTANEIYMSTVTKKMVSDGMAWVTVTQDGTTKLKDNTAAIANQNISLETLRLKLDNAKSALQGFTEKAKGKPGEDDQFKILSNNVAIAENNLEKGEIALKKLQDTSTRTEFVEVFKKVTNHTLTWNQAMEAAQPKVKELLGWVTKLGVESPFTEQSVTKTLQTGMSYGFTADKAKQITQALVDYGAASGKTNSNLELLAIAFGQIHARGKVLGQELRQLVNNGLDLNLVAGAMDMSMEELTKAQLAGTLSAEGMIDAFIRLSDERFKGAAKNLAFTWAGLVPTMQEIGRISLRDIFYEPLRAIEPVFGNFINIWQSLRPTMQEAGKTMVSTFKQASDTVSNFLTTLFPVPEEIQDVDRKTLRLLGEFKQTGKSVEDFSNRLSRGLRNLGLTKKTADSLATGLAKLRTTLSDSVSKAFEFLTQKVLPAVIQGVVFLADHWETLMSIFKGVGALFLASSALTTVLNLIKGFTSPVSILMALAGALGVAWDTNWNGIRDKVKDVWGTIKVVFNEIKNWLSDKSTLDMFAGNWSSTWGNAKTTIEDKWKGIKDVLEGIKLWFRSDFAGAMNTLIPTIIGLFTELKGVISEIATDIAGLFNFKMPTKPTALGPEKPAAPGTKGAFPTIASIVPETGTQKVAQGIQNAFMGLEKFLREDLTNALKNFRKDWEEAWPAIQKTVTDAINNIRDNVLGPIVTWINSHQKDWDAFKEALKNLGEALKPILSGGGNTGRSILVQFLDWLAKEGPVAIQAIADFLTKNGPQITKSLGDISKAVGDSETWKQAGAAIATFGATLAGIRLIDFFIDIGMWLGRAQAWIKGFWLPMIFILGGSVPIIVGIAAAWILNLGGIRDKMDAVLPSIANMTDETKALTAALLALAAALATGAIAMNIGAIGSAISGIRMGPMIPEQVKALEKKKIAPSLLTKADMLALSSLPPTLGERAGAFSKKMGKVGTAFGDLGTRIGMAFEPEKTTSVGMLPSVSVDWLKERRAALAGPSREAEIAKALEDLSKAKTAGSSPDIAKAMLALEGARALPKGPPPGALAEIAEIDKAIAKGGVGPKFLETTVPKGASGIWAELTAALKGFGKQMLLIFPGLTKLGALFTTPIGPILLVVGALALLGTAYATNLFGFRDAVNNVVGTVVAKFNELWASIQPIVQPIIDAFKQMWDSILGPAFQAVLSSWETLKGSFSSVSPLIQSLSAAWEGLKKAFETLWVAIQPIVNLLMQVLAPVLGVVAILVAGVATVIGGVLVFAIAGAATILVNGLAAAFNIAVSIITAAINEITAIINVVASVIQLVVDAVSAIFTGNWAKVWADAGKVGETFKTLLETTINSVYQILIGIFKGIGDLIVNSLKAWGLDWSGKWDEIKKKITDLDLAKVAEQLLQGFINGFVKKWNEVTDTVDRFAWSVINTIKTGWHIFSPSGVFEEIGKNLLQGLINGIEGLLGSLGTTLGKVKDLVLGIFGKSSGKEENAAPKVKIDLPEISTIQADWEKGWSNILKISSDAASKIKDIFALIKVEAIEDVPAAIKILERDWATSWNNISTLFTSVIWPSLQTSLNQLGVLVGTTLVLALVTFELKWNIMWPATAILMIASTSPVLSRLLELAAGIGNVRVALYGLRTMFNGFSFDLGPFNSLISKLHEVVTAANDAASAMSGMTGVAPPTTPASAGNGTPAPAPASTGGGGGTNANCFRAGTQVLTPKGSRNIEQLIPGDEVCTYDLTLKKAVVTRISGVTSDLRNDLIWLRTKGGYVFYCSPNHRFLTTRGWIEACSLVGHQIITLSGKDPVIQVKLYPGKHWVYNFEVEHKDHTYIVDGHVVHNRKMGAATGALYTTGPLVVGEKGPEILRPPMGSQVQTADATRRVLRRGEKQVVINMYPVIKNDIDIEVMAHRVAEYIKSRG